MTESTLNVAQICPVTRTLGPGKRAVIWVQGCPFTCRNCVSPNWVPLTPANLVKVSSLAAHITRLAGEERLEGITISGGEPMLQAGSLAKLLDIIDRSCPHLSVISFSGYTLEALRKKAKFQPEISEFLARIDVLIDGLYIEKKNDARGLRGSSNQRMHFLTDRYVGRREEFEMGPRSTEFHLLDSEVLMVGVPTPIVLKSFRSMASKVL